MNCDLYFSAMNVFRCFVVGLLLAIGAKGISQTTVKIMSYNTLNFPIGLVANRQDTLKKILDYVQPDLLMLQEVRNGSSLNLIINSSFSNVPGNFEASTFVPNQSSSFALNQLQHAVIYNTQVFGLADEYLRTTHLRDINVFKLYFQEDALAEGGDTTFVYAFVTHLKAGQGSNNEQERLSMIEVFVDELSNIPPESYVLFGGDLNLYSSSEPAYQLILNQNNPIVFEDPISAPGNWGANSYPFREVHTQSTRESTIFDDGSGGGVDDRFDFILVSTNLKSPSSPVRYKTGSYKALGNNGTCHNQSITECAVNNDVPLSILRAMYYFSDHLPVVMELELDFDLSIQHPQNSVSTAQVFVFNKVLHAQFDPVHQQCQVLIFDLNGRMVEAVHLTQNSNKSLHHLSDGVYISVVLDSQNQQILSRQKLILR